MEILSSITTRDLCTSSSLAMLAVVTPVGHSARRQSKEGLLRGSTGNPGKEGMRLTEQAD